MITHLHFHQWHERSWHVFYWRWQQYIAVVWTEIRLTHSSRPSHDGLFPLSPQLIKSKRPAYLENVKHCWSPPWYILKDITRDMYSMISLVLMNMYVYINISAHLRDTINSKARFPPYTCILAGVITVHDISKWQLNMITIMEDDANACCPVLWSLP